MQSLLSSRLRVGLIVGLVLTVILLLLWRNGIYQGAQLRFTDTYFVARPTSEQVVIVGLDDRSFQTFGGRTPSDWPRERFAQLVDRLSAGGARVIGFDLLFTEPSPDDAAFVEQLVSARRESAARTQFVTAAAGVQIQADTPTERSLRYQDALLPLESIQAAVSYLGFVNAIPDTDSAIRRQPSIIEADGETYFSFALATYFAYLRIPALATEQLITVADDQLRVDVEDGTAITIDQNGLWRQNFYGSTSTDAAPTFPIVSMVDVLEMSDEDAQALFADKIVLVGLYTISGDADRYAVPSTALGEQMPGVEIHANAVETLIQQHNVREISPLVQALLIGGATMLATVLYIYLRWYIKLLLAGVLILVSVIAAMLSFSLMLVIVPMFYPVLGIVLPAVTLIGVDTSREISLRLRSDFLLQSVVEISEQRLVIDAMLPKIAADIQQLLPESAGVIYARMDADANLTQAYSWHDPQENHTQWVRQVEMTHAPLQAGATVAIPIEWQRRTLGVVIVTHPQARRRLPILLDLTRRLAPAFENAYLYQEVASQRSTLSTLLASTPSAVLVLDKAYRVTLYNDIAATLFGGVPLQGQALADVLTSLDVVDSERDEILAKLQTGSIFRDELPVGDDTYQVEGALIPALDEWVLIFTDITDVTELSNLKTRMLRMASHDLKNPLGRITGYTQLIEMRPDIDLDPKVKKYLGYIEDAAGEMNMLIRDILDLERMRSGQILREAFSFRDLVAQVISRHEPDAAQKQQTYTSSLPDDPLMTVGDLRQLSQVVSNLIGNAIKYTPEGGSIDTRLRAAADTIYFEVEDTGYGISPDAQENLFTEFYRVKTAHTAKISGTGLGLSLVKSVVTAHNGEVGVESEEGAGSRFYFRLPIVEKKGT